ncbi:MAG TPA: AMP-binding protein [Thermoanaerobaculia bacterium]|nr:AMP-binding protein [Thermoanaerobaculia bacterium]
MRHATVLDAFADSLARAPEQTAIRIVAGAGEEEALSYEALYREASRAAAGLAARGLRRGDRFLGALPTSREFFAVYFGALFSGVVPIVVAAPRPERPNRPSVPYAPPLDQLAQVAGARWIVGKSWPPAPQFSVLQCVTAHELCESDGAPLPLTADPHAIAHLQATSGSTRTPRLAIVRHRNIAANVDAIGRAIRHRDGDVLVTWLPFFHDMGIIGISYALGWQCPLVASDPATFVRNQLSWLRTISRHRGTLSPAPNSAYEVCARVAARRAVEDLDLSSWRVALCGAEPVRRSTLARFIEAFGRHGFRPETMLPVYGLAEATLAVTIPDPDALYGVDENEGVVSVGSAVPGHEVRIVDREARPLPERQVGEIEVRGPSVIDGYWGEGDGELKREDGFLRTGDLGYLSGGELYVTGRIKDIIIIGGRNISPVQVEALVEPIVGGGIAGGVAACGVPDPHSQTEMLHVLVESESVPRADAAAVEEHARAVLAEAYGISGVTIHWLPRGSIARTTSGKIQRYRCREWVESAR